MTAAAVVGVTLAELAARRGLTVAQLEALLRPFVEAGIVVVRGGAYVVADRLVAAALVDQEETPSP